MVVVAIIAILASMAVAAYGRIGASSAPRNAINDLTASLTRARNAATENQSDVWVIFYPTYDRRTNALTGGPGAYFLYEDKAGRFNVASGGVATEVYYRTTAGGVSFDPVANTLFGSTSVEGRLIDSVFLDDYPGNNVVFALPTGGVTMTAKEAPFTGLAVGSACTFCSANRGAIIFSAEGSARFVDGTGTAVAANGAGAANRAQALTIKDRPTPTTETRVYVVAVSGPTAFIGMYDKR